MTKTKEQLVEETMAKIYNKIPLHSDYLYEKLIKLIRETIGESFGMGEANALKRCGREGCYCSVGKYKKAEGFYTDCELGCFLSDPTKWAKARTYE